MSESCESCPMERVHEVEYRLLSGKLTDVNRRVERLETQLGRGILLMVANLAGVITTLAHELMQS